jgi:hypothetical protein
MNLGRRQGELKFREGERYAEVSGSRDRRVLNPEWQGTWHLSPWEVQAFIPLSIPVPHSTHPVLQSSSWEATKHHPMQKEPTVRTAREEKP